MKRVGLLLVAACHHSATPAGTAKRDPCALVEAMLAIESEAYQQIYRGCGDEVTASPRVVDVHAPSALVPPGTRCTGRSFVLLSQAPAVAGLIVRFDVAAAGNSWNFQASRYQPNVTEVSTGGFESAESYCHAVAGFIEWREGRWRTFVDVDRALAPAP